MKFNLSRSIAFFLILSGLFFSGNVMASGSGGHDSGEEFSISELAMDHIKDSHDWHLWDWHGHPVSIPLPVILFTDGHLDVFLSSAFHHGETTVEKDGRIYALEDGKIIEQNGLAVYDFSITRNVASMLLVAFLMMLVFIGSAKAYKKQGEPGPPKGIAKFTEPIIIWVRDEIAIPNIGKDKYQKFLPYLLTVFFFIWINNLLGIIPIFPGGSNVTGNISVTMTLAVFTLILTNINGNKHYWQHVLWMPGVPFYVKPILTIIEVASVLTKPFALMIRLFANITAGHIIILSLVSLIFLFQSYFIAPISVAFGLFMDVLELLVAALQAFIFTLLSALFIGMAVEEHHEEHPEHEVI